MMMRLRKFKKRLRKEEVVGMEVMVKGVKEAMHVQLLQVGRKLCHLLLKKKKKNLSSW